MTKEIKRSTEIFLESIDAYNSALDALVLPEYGKDLKKEKKEVEQIKKITKSCQEKLKKYIKA